MKRQIRIFKFNFHFSVAPGQAGLSNILPSLVWTFNFLVFTFLHPFQFFSILLNKNFSHFASLIML